MLNLSLVKLIEIVGEAANRISPEAQTKYPAILWQKIIAMRNRLIHGYDNVDFDILYQSISQDLPSLIAKLEAIVLHKEKP